MSLLRHANLLLGIRFYYLAIAQPHRDFYLWYQFFRLLRDSTRSDKAALYYCLNSALPTCFTNPNRNGNLHPFQQTEEPSGVPAILSRHHPSSGLHERPDGEQLGCQLAGAHERPLPERRRAGECSLLPWHGQWYGIHSPWVALMNSTSRSCHLSPSLEQASFRRLCS